MMMSIDLQTQKYSDSLPRLAVITGAANGIGRALAMEAARSGIDLAIADTDASGLLEVGRAAEKCGVQVLTEVLDIRSASSVADFSERVFKSGVQVGFVFANAGVLRAGPAAYPVLEDWNLIVDVNLRGAINTIAAFVPRLIMQKRRAQFVFTASHASLLAIPSLAIYSATKHAVWALAESLQRELKETSPNIGISVICPGAIRTNILDGVAKRAIRGDISAEKDAAIESARMSPDVLARQVFDALEARPFWIHSHPNILADVEQRFADVLAGRDPR